MADDDDDERAAALSSARQIRRWADPCESSGLSRGKHATSTGAFIVAAMSTG